MMLNTQSLSLYSGRGKSEQHRAGSLWITEGTYV